MRRLLLHVASPAVLRSTVARTESPSLKVTLPAYPMWVAESRLTVALRTVVFRGVPSRVDTARSVVVATGACSICPTPLSNTTALVAEEALRMKSCRGASDVPAWTGTVTLLVDASPAAHTSVPDRAS